MAKGFNVIELIIVMVIIGILAVTVIPRMVDQAPISSREAAEMVAADIRHTQELALSGIASQSLIFVAGSNTYTAGNRSVTLPAGVVIGTSTTITFDRHGVPSAQPTFSIQVGGATVSVTPQTGRVVVS